MKNEGFENLDVELQKIEDTISDIKVKSDSLNNEESKEAVETLKKIEDTIRSLKVNIFEYSNSLNFTDAAQDLKKEFSFLTEHFLFKGIDYPSMFSAQVFFKYEDTFYDGEEKVTSSGSFAIPFDNNHGVNWFFREDCDSYKKEYRKLESTPEWFQDFYEKVQEQLKNRER